MQYQPFSKVSRYLLLGMIGLLALTCSRNPVTGKKELMLLSEQQEIQMGANYDPSVVANFGLYQDDKLQAFIEEKGQKMAKISHRPNLNYEFKILDSPVVNAFAVPGGYVYFTRGIMAHFNNEAEFAGVLGHEIGHITAKHSAKQYSKQMLAQVGLIAGVVASKEFRQFADVAQQGMGLLFLKFGRDNESQSDRLGVEYSTKIGYDAHHMAQFFTTLKRMRRQQGGETVPTFLSTHPDPADRERKVGQMADQWQADLNKSNLKVNRERYLRMIDGLVYGEDPRQGFVENNKFYHPELKFQFPVPQSWQTANSPSQFQMAERNGKAAIILTLSQKKTLAETRQEIVEKYNMTLLKNRNIRVDGLSAMELTGDVKNETDPTKNIRVFTYLIQYNQNIYILHGLSLVTDFPTYQYTFEQTMKNFKRLTDPTKLNVQPDRIEIKKVSRAGTLSNVLKSFRVAGNKMDEHSLINGMELSQNVPAGTLIKVVKYGR
ncbi:MAG: M48 family metalloprotease [Bacteroidota bacterium]